MAYPFTNNQHAQTSSTGYHGEGGYNDPYSTQQQSTQFGRPSSYEYEPSMVARDAQRDTSSAAPYGSYANQAHDDNVQEEKAVGRSPYETAPEMLSAPYRGNSIWKYDDKRVMAKRSVPARIFRVLFCTIINTIIVIISIVCLVVIFARPPNVGIGTIVNPSESSVGVSGSALTVNGSVDFIISNPNSISATLSSLKANIYDKVDESEAIGSTTISNQKIAANSNTTINFPYQIKYDPTADTSQAILKDLISKCGLDGGSTSDLNLVLKVDSKISILAVPIPISFNQDISFECPLTASVLKSIGIDGLSSLTRRTWWKRWANFMADRQEL